MASKKFTASEWKKIFDLAEDSAEEFGLPARRSKSVVLGTFNIRKLGEVKKRSPGPGTFSPSSAGASISWPFKRSWTISKASAR